MLSKKLKSLAAWLRRHYPATMPVVVRTSRMTDCHGKCLIGEERALIRLAESDSDTIQCETLLEEWAHVLRHESPVPCQDDHDQIFWGILATITKHYRGE